jgi:hypothetical protein
MPQKLTFPHFTFYPDSVVSRYSSKRFSSTSFFSAYRCRLSLAASMVKSCLFLEIQWSERDKIFAARITFATPLFDTTGQVN